MPPLIEFWQSGHTGDFTWPMFLRHVEDAGLRTISTRSWPTPATTFDAPEFDRRMVSITGGRLHRIFAVVKSEPGAALLEFEDGQVQVWVGAGDEARAADLLAQIRAAVPEAAPAEGKRVPLWLWTLTQNGPRKIRRVIDVPSWEDIAGNYTASVRDRLDEVCRERPTGGQILLWDGVPGTGKTFALRALAYSWREWCSVHYVTDPEVLFGPNSHYLIDVLLDHDDYLHSGKREDEQWRLLILEDAGEMLTLDAKERVGQGLSRLLNVTDGLIGQGTRVLILVTTNEQLGRLHPAIVRAGRCASHISFGPLTATEAEAWLERRGVRRPIGSTTIADLYGIVEGHETATNEKVVGFQLRRG